MKKLKYYLQESKQFFCPNCLRQLDILSSDSIKLPIFFICWSCKEVTRSGVFDGVEVVK